MSRGSTFALFRAYNKVKVDESVMKSLQDEYYKSNMESSWCFHSYNGDSEEATRKREQEREERARRDIPLIMDMTFRADDENQWEESRCSTIADVREKYGRYVLKTDGRYLDKLLEWNFTSGFDCLISEFGLDYSLGHSAVLVDDNTAREMLSAAEYLLGGRYDDAIAATMHNRFIDIFADGCNCCSYWKYLNRHRGGNHASEYSFSTPDGIMLTLKLDNTPRKSPDGEDDDEVAYREQMECDTEMETYLRDVVSALKAFLTPDEWSFHDDTSLLMVYYCWG